MVVNRWKIKMNEKKSGSFMDDLNEHEWCKM